jgi:hypothetical protein
VYKNRVVRRIFGIKGESNRRVEKTVGCQEVHRNWSSSIDITANQIKKQGNGGALRTLEVTQKFLSHVAKDKLCFLLILQVFFIRKEASKENTMNLIVSIRSKYSLIYET